MPIHPKNDCHNGRGQASHYNKASLTPHDSGIDNTSSTNLPPHCSNNWPHDWPHSGQQCDASPPCPCNQCGFSKDTNAIEWTEYKMHNPTTGAQTIKDFKALHQSTNPPKSSVHPASDGLWSNLPPHCNCDCYSTYHIDNNQCSSQCHTCSWSHSCSHSCSCDCYHHDCHN